MGGAGELLRSVDRSMLFGDASTTKMYKHDPRVELHGPGFSKVILGEDAADEWEKYLDVMVQSVSVMKEPLYPYTPPPAHPAELPLIVQPVRSSATP